MKTKNDQDVGSICLDLLYSNLVLRIIEKYWALQHGKCVGKDEAIEREQENVTLFEAGNVPRIADNGEACCWMFCFQELCFDPKGHLRGGQSFDSIGFERIGWSTEAKERHVNNNFELLDLTLASEDFLIFLGLYDYCIILCWLYMISEKDSSFLHLFYLPPFCLSSECFL